MLKTNQPLVPVISNPMAIHNNVKILKDFTINTDNINETKLSLRPYQEECILKIMENHKLGNNRGLVNLPVASGKTVIFSHLIKIYKKQTIVLAHTTELINQAKNKIMDVYPEAKIGVVDQYHKEFDADIIVTSPQSAAQDNNLQRLIDTRPELLIVDETHRYSTPSARKIIDALGFAKNITSNKLFCGFTATPFRYKSTFGLGELFDCIFFEKTTQEMIEEGWLVKPIAYKIVNDLDMSHVKTEDGDFEEASLSRLMNTPELLHKVVDSYEANAFGMHTICFGVSVEHAENLNLAFKERGISSDVVHGKMPRKDREAVLRKYESHEIKVLVNCSLLAEGYDAAWTECVIIARPTQSPGLFVQMVGRGLRLYPLRNKTHAIILDFGSKNHTLCNIALLLNDAEIKEKDSIEKKEKQLLKSLPAKLDPILKAAYVRSNLYNDDFNWERDDRSRSYWLRSTMGHLRVAPSGDKFSTILEAGTSREFIAKNVPFDHAFEAAALYVREHKAEFIFSDKNAPWRQYPISPDQIKKLKRLRLTRGINKLLRGQAYDIISSICNTL